jgi:ABC-type branched-subunit amino acid transport system ATPase component
MLSCEVPPSGGRVTFRGQDITNKSVTAVCQLGLTKSYQVNQLFNRLTVRENVTIAALAALRGKFRLDLFRGLRNVRGLDEQVEHTLQLVNLRARRDTPVSELAYGEKRRLEIGLALATSPRLLLLDEPLAGMSPRERIETVKLLKSIARDRTMIIIDHDMDSLFELVERVTVLQEGSVWNTMPAHTHARRTEVYLYFAVPQEAVVVHLMGEPDQTRHLVVRNEEVALSPGWSIHSGCGTAAYSFCWAMGGENQVFADMQGVAMDALR